MRCCRACAAATRACHVLTLRCLRPPVDGYGTETFRPLCQVGLTHSRVMRSMCHAACAGSEYAAMAVRLHALAQVAISAPPVLTQCDRMSAGLSSTAANANSGYGNSDSFTTAAVGCCHVSVMLSLCDEKQLLLTLYA
jgi:hypothetical protein